MLSFPLSLMIRILLLIGRKMTVISRGRGRGMVIEENGGRACYLNI